MWYMLDAFDNEQFFFICLLIFLETRIVYLEFVYFGDVEKERVYRVVACATVGWNHHFMF